MIDYVSIDNSSNMKFSVLLSEELNYSYTYLANFFSEMEVTTIEQYVIVLKLNA